MKNVANTDIDTSVELITPNAEKMTTVHLPKAQKGEENFVFVSVNLKGYKIMKGVDVEVPESVAEVLKHSEQMKELADEYESAQVSD